MQVTSFRNISLWTVRVVFALMSILFAIGILTELAQGASAARLGRTGIGLIASLIVIWTAWRQPLKP